MDNKRIIMHGVLPILTLFIVCAMCVLEANATVLNLSDSPIDETSFCVSDSCSGHVHFMQAAAREDGSFIIYSRNTTSTEAQKQTFSQVYIDIYASDGSFLQELSFSSPFDLAVELAETHVNIYFPSFLLAYKLDTGELHGVELPEHFAFESGLYKSLREETFSCGDWEYQYLKKYGENIGLIRKNALQEEILVELSGSTTAFWKIWPPLFALSMLLILLVKRAFRKK